MRLHTHANRPWLVITELMIFGFFNSILRVLSIIALLSFDAIFTSSSQLLLLLPAAGCVLLVLLVSVFADAQCQQYMARLDSRLVYIRDLLQAHDKNNPNSFLQRIFLPLLVNIPATPVMGFFLAVTSPWLFGILVLNIVVNGVIIARYNRRTRLSSAKSVLVRTTKSDIHTDNPSITSIPTYLLRDQIQGQALLDEDDAPAVLESSEEHNFQRQKSKALEAARTFFHGLILAASTLLALLRLSSLGGIVGFFIIGITFRKSFVALCEFLYPRGERITFREAYNLLALSLLSTEQVQARLQNRYDERQQILKRFNERFASLIKSRPFLRFRNVSVTHAHDGIVLDKITARLEISACTAVRIPSLRTGQQLRSILRQIELQRFHDWYVDGQVISAGKPLGLTFLSQLPIRAPWKVRVSSAKLHAAFSPHQHDRVMTLIKNYDLDQLLYGDDSPAAELTMLSKRQIQRLRSMISLLILILEPACMSVGAFIIEPFEPNEITILLRMLQAESNGLESNTILLTRRSLNGLESIPCYELSRTSLQRLNP